MPTLLSKTFQGIGVSTAASIGAFFVWTKHCHWVDMDPATDPLLQSTWYKKFNPNSNPPFYDTYTRKIPLFKMKPELVRDASMGGSKLVEAFCQGVWGGFGYAPQRGLLNLTNRNEKTVGQLWTKQQLLTDTYEPGTGITDHCTVLEKTPNTILIRTGGAPDLCPDGPRELDGLLLIRVDANLEKGYAEFSMKCAFYQGLGPSKSGNDPPMKWAIWPHNQYSKLLLESSLSNVKQ